MNASAPTRPLLLDRMSAISDVVRCRILSLVERQELTVSEICAVIQLPQSTISRHLKALGDQDWVLSRRHGTRRLYRLPVETLPAPARRLWSLTREQLSESPALEHDALRLAGVIAARRARSREFFDASAEQWDRLRDELFGRHVVPLALLGLLDRRWCVGDLGCGTGAVASALAPFVERVVAVDGSRAMLESARRRLAGATNVEPRVGDLEALPIDDGELDAATLVLVLHHAPDPGRVLQEVRRSLCSRGRLLIVDMLPHDRAEYQHEMGHVWLGFSEEELARALGAAGLSLERFVALPPDTSARGPALFAATAVREAEPELPRTRPIPSKETAR